MTPAKVMSVSLHRAYESDSIPEGHRVLVDRVWPRGVRRDDLNPDEWRKELAPSSELRKWFGHDPDRWEEFRRRYREELRERGEALDDLREVAERGPLVLLFGARDREHNQAVVLRELIEGGG